MTTRLMEDPKSESEPGEGRLASTLDEMMDQTLRAKYDFWIQILPNWADGSTEGVYMSTYQKGRGQQTPQPAPHGVSAASGPAR